VHRILITLEHEACGETRHDNESSCETCSETMHETTKGSMRISGMHEQRNTGTSVVSVNPPDIMNNWQSELMSTWIDNWQSELMSTWIDRKLIQT
jgi:hypothetical protein